MKLTKANRNTVKLHLRQLTEAGRLRLRGPGGAPGTRWLETRTRHLLAALMVPDESGPPSQGPLDPGPLQADEGRALNPDLGSLVEARVRRDGHRPGPSRVSLPREVRRCLSAVE